MGQGVEEEQVQVLAQKAREYLRNEQPQHQTPRITNNPDVWLQECVAILSETSIEMVHMMAKKPQEIAPFMRVFSLVTTLAADSKKLLQQGAGKPPPIAPLPSSGDNDDMEPRVKALELFALEARDRLVRLETKIDAVATREDMHKEIGSQTWRIVGAMLTIGAAMSAAVFFIARNVT